MRMRPGVSLVEVLVASVLLAIGIGGTMQAMLASARLQLDADHREALVGVMLDRLLWFEARACTLPDTAGQTALAGGPEARWRVRVDSLARTLELEGQRRTGAPAARTRVAVRITCG